MTNYSLEPRFIAIEGCVGAGKTSLVNLLGKQFDAQIVREVDEENQLTVIGFNIIMFDLQRETILAG
jgi:thymidylate kinase